MHQHTLKLTIQNTTTLFTDVAVALAALFLLSKSKICKEEWNKSDQPNPGRHNSQVCQFLFLFQPPHFSLAYTSPLVCVCVCVVSVAHFTSGRHSFLFVCACIYKVTPNNSFVVVLQLFTCAMPTHGSCS